jgi:hypothetical protein
MKLRFAAFAAIMLAATLLVASCNKGASNSNGTNAPASNSNGGRETSSSPTTGGSPTTTAPAGTVSASTPTEAFRSYYEAIKRKDAAAVKSLFSKATVEALEKNAAQKNTTFDEVFKEGLESASKEIPASVPETRNEKIEGDKATLEVKDDKKGSWETLRFVNEGGQWKIAFADIN